MTLLLRRALLGLGTAVFATALACAPPSRSHGPEEAAFLAKSDAAMARMTAAMQVKLSGDADRDFVALMAPHHQGAIDMAAAELSYGRNERLRRLAQEIVVTQREEIVELRLALVGAAASLSTGPEEAAFFAESKAAMERMMAAMEVKPSNDSDVDRDFVALMAPHHQGGIDMAAAELSYGHNEPLRGLAQEIIATQEQEIDAMRRALGEPLPPTVPPSIPSSSSSMLADRVTPAQEA